MLKIIGYYNSQGIDSSLKQRIQGACFTHGRFTQVQTFEQKDLFLAFESYHDKDAERFSSVNEAQRIACFIVGNIYSYDKDGVKPLAEVNLAEYVLKMYRADGFEFLKHLRGAFNIVIYDQGKVYLANDRLGTSAMYIYDIPGGHVFASVPDDIINLGQSNTLDLGAVAEFLVYGFIPHGKTFIQGLVNQEPASVTSLDSSGRDDTIYTEFLPADIKGMSEREILQRAHDIFHEGITVRLPQEGRTVFTDLTGGWDTRYVLAHLAKTDRDIAVRTEDLDAEDTVIAGMLAKQYKLDHFIQKYPEKSGDGMRMILDDQFARRQNEEYFKENEDYLMSNYQRWVEMGFYTRPKFIGLFGTELLGYTPAWFNDHIRLNLVVSGDKLLKRGFLKKALSGKSKEELMNPFDRSQSPVYMFVDQITRCSLNVHNSGWERPASFFQYRQLIPFTDHNFVSFLSALEYTTYFNYRLYEILYKKFFPEYYGIPWTFVPGRPEHNLKQKPEPYPVRPQQNPYGDENFRQFLKEQIFVKEEQVESRTAQLYYVYRWLGIYKDVLSGIEDEVGQVC